MTNDELNAILSDVRRVDADVAGIIARLQAAKLSRAAEVLGYVTRDLAGCMGYVTAALEPEQTSATPRRPLTTAWRPGTQF